MSWRHDRKPRIYLAGKIAKNDWRSQVVAGGLRSVIADHNFDDYGSDWPIVDGVFDTFHYVGPYFVGCDHGCGHGPATHGYGTAGCIDWRNEHDPRGLAREACLSAIEACDVFYAWVDDETAYGTLVEIGYAEAHGKTIILDGSAMHVDPLKENELWFAARAGQNWQSYGSTAVESVRNYTAEWRHQNPKLESEIEYLFWDAWMPLEGLRDVKLTPSLPVKGADGKNYRLDFACVDRKVAIELDGHKWHSGPDVFVTDRARQRALTAAGWTFIRYAGREIVESADKCAHEAFIFLDAQDPATPTA